MKIVKYLLSAAALLSFGACNHEGDEIVIAQTEPSFTAHSDVVVNKSTEAEDFTLVWSPAKFGYKTDVEYTVGAEYGEQSLVLGSTSATYFSTTNMALLSQFAIEEAGEYDITFNLSAVTPAGETAEAKPMVVKFVYDIPVVVEEAYLYIVGDYQGWDPAGSCSRLKLHADNKYYGFVNLPEGGTYEFKFCAEQSWDGTNYGLKDGVLSTEPDAGNFKADAAGLLYIVFDAVNATYEMTPITYVGLIGDAVGGWDNDKAQFEFDAENNVWVANAPVEAGKNFKIRFNQVWDLTDLGGDVADLQFKGSDIAATETGSGVFTLNIFDFPYTLNIAVTPGEGPVTPEPDPDPSGGVYHLVGGFNGWDIADTTYEFKEAASNGYLVVKNVPMTMVDYTVDGEGWKIAFNHDWANPNYSSEGLVELGVPTLFKQTSLNSGLAAEGNYDFYFNPETKYVIVVEAGAQDPTGGSSSDEPSEHEGFRIYVENKAGYSPIAAYAWTDGGENLFGGWPGTVMTDYEDINGVRYYYVDLGEEHAGKTFQIIFNNNGAGKQTADSAKFVLDKDYFFVAEHGIPAYEADTTPVIPSFYVAGDFNSWGDIPMEDLAETLHVHKGATFATDGGFKIKAAAGQDGWADDMNYGSETTDVIAIGTPINTIQPGNNIMVPAGTYDLYFNSATKQVCVVTAGSASPF
ncbi:MAG: starch-binding protein [Rikenellaceae bacterium]|nr:starch-binding protein [Rikenellaceae bacterium]